MHQDVYKAYHRASHTVAKTRQIVMLYDGVLRNLKQAKDASAAGDVSTRFQKLVRAGDIIMGLQSSIDFDAGGDVARILYDFYSSIDARILSTLNGGNTPVLDQLMQEIRDMRDVWEQIDKNQGEVSSDAAAKPASPAMDVGVVSA